MAALSNRTLGSVENFAQLYDFLMVDLADPRTNDWFLIRDPVCFYIVGVYLMFVLRWGPAYMKDRKPMAMKGTLVFYNAVQVAVSVYLLYEGLDAAWLYKYSWRCQPVDYSRSPEALRVARAVYIYYLAKLSELLDTVFFVLRKRDRQITFLHLYHHCVMPMVSWGASKYYPGGHGTLIGVINSFVHVIMYSYYLLAALGPQLQKYLWWKKYITTLQMAQFCLAFLHSAQLLVVECDYPKWSLMLVLPNTIFFYYLFNDFYSKSYEKAQKQKIEDGHKQKAEDDVQRKKIS